MSNNKVLNVSVNDGNMIEDKFKSLNIISEDWLVVDKSECDKSASYLVSNDNENVHSKSSSVHNLKPYVPFPVEELAFTTSLDTWSNCNVRVAGLLQATNESHYLESINETGGPYKILLSFEQMGGLPSSNQVIQVFGTIKISQNNNDIVPFIRVLFYRILEISDLSVYMEAIEYMRQFIPLFLKGNVNSRGNNDAPSDKKEYYDYHRLDNSNKNNDRNHEIGLYSNDDFNHAYNTDYLF